jgi:hypothetical protein
MEKKYIKPEIQVIEVELQPMMAASAPLGSVDINDTPATEDAAAKGHGNFDVWGLDEE